MKELKMPQSPPLTQVFCGNHMWEGWEGEAFPRWSLPPPSWVFLCLQPQWQESEVNWSPQNAGVYHKQGVKVPCSDTYLFAWKTRIALDLNVHYSALFTLFLQTVYFNLCLGKERSKERVEIWDQTQVKKGAFGQVAHWTRSLSFANDELYIGVTNLDLIIF